MNICLLVNSFNLGGAEKLVFDIAEQLNNEFGIVVVAMKRAETEFENTVEAELNKKGITTDTVNKPVGKEKISAILNIVRLLKKYNIDILHTHGQSPDFYGRIAAFLYRKAKAVVTIHNTDGYSVKNETLLKKLTDVYTAVSDETNVYCKNSLGIMNAVTINNGIDFNRYPTDKKTDNKIILSVGRVVPQKGYLNIVLEMNDYLKANPDLYWYIVGETTQNPEYFEKLKAKIHESIRDRVVFTGAVTNTEEYYKNAKVFLLPSEFEGFGIAFIEAMASRLPVICNKVGVISNVIALGGKVFNLKDGTLSEIFEKIDNISEEELDFNYEYCKNNYSIESVAEQYAKIYRSVLGEKR